MRSASRRSRSPTSRYFHGSTGQTPGDAALGDPGRRHGDERRLDRLRPGVHRAGSSSLVSRRWCILLGYLWMLWDERESRPGTTRRAERRVPRSYAALAQGRRGSTSQPSRRRATCRARAREQLVVRALLDDLAVLEHDDQVGVADRREAVRDDERGPAVQEAAERALDLALGADVDRARRLVEDQDPRVGEQRARERDELALAEREPRAALAELRLVAVLEPLDELVGADGPRGGDRSPRGSRPGRPKAMFSATVPAKRKPSCGTIPSWRRSDSCVDVAQVDAVDRDAPLGRVVEAREQLRDRRLAGAGVADERDGRARRARRGRSRAAPRARGRRRSGRPRTRRAPAMRVELDRARRRRAPPAPRRAGR